MIRRPPTMISLGDEELERHLQRIYLHTLPNELSQLHLDDQDQNYNDDTLFGPSDSCSSSNEAEKIFGLSTIRHPAQGSSCTGHQPSSTQAAALKNSTARPTSTNTELVHQPVDTNNAPATTAAATATTPQMSAALSRRRTSPPRERSTRKVTWATLPQHLEMKETRDLWHRQRKKGLFISILEGEQNDLRESSPQDVWATRTTKVNDDMRIPTAQNPCLPPDAIMPNITISSVPLGDLALASTQSYEIVLANTEGLHAMVSPRITVDTTTLKGAIIPSDLGVKERSADRECV
ncbi:uncharacterized protein N7459_006611 [Penicillium hispanicum]|uniref:uncharacterized protein n=1 Tax=Penicillium hispanicum TaxID=1080232 RepID=UPI0025400775|nr:uncharacterized protein N7459_006611 [Penicillium hispanicum]KAJ5577647.1 hypothetical protein N7459_006611 [Penicillium hispanicum]